MNIQTIQYMYEEINMHNLYLMTKCLRIFCVTHNGNKYHILQIVRGGKLLWFAELSCNFSHIPG